MGNLEKLSAEEILGELPEVEITALKKMGDFDDAVYYIHGAESREINPILDKLLSIEISLRRCDRVGFFRS